jgi:ribosome-associated protein
MPRPRETPLPVADESETLSETPSKTRRKHAMHALQALGEELVALDPKRLAQLELPERLVDAIGVARGVHAHEGRRRQLQYVGKLMRTIDAEPIQAALARWSSGVPPDQALFAAAERWRDLVLADDSALDRFVAEHPHADRAALASLVREARIERTRAGPPHRYRELFRTLKTAIDTPA